MYSQNQGGVKTVMNHERSKKIFSPINYMLIVICYFSWEKSTY